MLRIFIGYDPRQPISYTALQASILHRASQPVAFTPLILGTLPLKRQGLTPFTYSRFLVPHLCGYEGWGLFMDADMIALDDIAKLFALGDPDCDVMAVKGRLKFEWASLMLFNNARCRKLTPDYIETAEGLHKLDWAERIGELPPEWNHCVGYDESRADAKIVHYTQGVPCWHETADCEHAAAWHAEHARANDAEPWKNLMARSVHARPVIERMMRGYAAAAGQVAEKANGHAQA